MIGCSAENNTDKTSQRAAVNIENISAIRANEIINFNKDKPEFNILDIRTPQEYRAGHIANSINVDYYSADFENKLDGMDKSKIYLIYCRSGSRSGRAMSIMSEQGFVRVYNLANGIIDWQQNKLLLEK